MARFLHILFLVIACVTFVHFAGCNKSAEEPQDGGAVAPAASEEGMDPHDVPITDQQKDELRAQTAQFADAVAKLQQFRDQVEQETAEGLPANPFSAHQALDQADLVLQWLPEIARDSGVPKENWETINTAANELRTLFEQVHQKIDEKQDPEFAAVADAMEQQLSALGQIETTSN